MPTPLSGRCGPRRGSFLLAAVLLGALAARQASAADEVIPPKPALTLLVRILMYDRNFSPKGDGEFVLAVVHEPGQKAELAQVMEAAEETRTIPFKDRVMKFVPVELKPQALGPFRQALAKANASAMVLVAGLSAASVETIARVSAEEKLYTLSLDPVLVEKSAAIGIVKEGTKEGSRNRILLNRDILVRMKSSFEPTLLKIARIYM